MASDTHTIAAARRALARPRADWGGSDSLRLVGRGAGRESRRAKILQARLAPRYLASRPVSLLGFRADTEVLVESLERLGVRTLGELRKLGRHALTDRFGESGALAYRLAGGEDGPLAPRGVEDHLEESLEVGDAGSGPMLERVLEVLVDRLLARPERRGRSVRAVVLSARLVSGGTWRARVVFRQALGDGKRMCLALSLRLSLLPAPAESLSLGVERFGPGEGSSTLLGAKPPGTPRTSWRGRQCASIRIRVCPSAGLCSRHCRDENPSRPEHAACVLALAGRNPQGGERRADRSRKRVVAGGGSLVDGHASAPTLLGAGQRAWAQLDRFPRPVLRWLVHARSLGETTVWHASICRAALPLGVLVPGWHIAARGACLPGSPAWAYRSGSHRSQLGVGLDGAGPRAHLTLATCAGSSPTLMHTHASLPGASVANPQSTCRPCSTLAGWWSQPSL